MSNDILFVLYIIIFDRVFFVTILLLIVYKTGQHSQNSGVNVSSRVANK